MTLTEKRQAPASEEAPEPAPPERLTLSEAIVKGHAQVSGQMKCSWYNGHDVMPEACVKGMAIVGTYDLARLQQEYTSGNPRRLFELLFPQADDKVDVPEAVRERYGLKRMKLAALLVVLNDELEWTPERIAHYIKARGY